MPGPPRPRDRRSARIRVAGAALAGVAGVASMLGCGGTNALDAAGVERFAYQATPAAGPPATIAAWRAGPATAPRIIYVHGTPGTAAAFAAYLTDPLPGFEAITIDRPGFGASADAGSWTSFADQSAALEPLLVERDGRWPILVGHSLGGPIVARAAADHPDRVGAIVILAGSLDPGLEEPLWLNHLAATPLVRIFLPRSLRHSNDELMAAPGETRSLDEALHQVRCPVAILHGERDSLVPVANVEFMEDRFAANWIDVQVLRGAGHLLPWKQEDAVRGAIGRAHRMREEAGRWSPTADIATPAEPSEPLGMIATP